MTDQPQRTLAGISAALKAARVPLRQDLERHVASTELVYVLNLVHDLLGHVQQQQTQLDSLATTTTTTTSDSTTTEPTHATAQPATHAAASTTPQPYLIRPLPRDTSPSAQAYRAYALADVERALGEPITYTVDSLAYIRNGHMPQGYAGTLLADWHRAHPTIPLPTPTPQATHPDPSTAVPPVQANHAWLTDAPRPFQVGDLVRRRNGSGVYGRIVELSEEPGLVWVLWDNRTLRSLGPVAMLEHAE